VIIAAAVVGGCASIAVMSHIPVSTMSRLFALKLANIDPEELRVAAYSGTFDVDADLHTIPAWLKHFR